MQTIPERKDSLIACGVSAQTNSWSCWGASEPPRKAGSISVVLQQVVQFWILDYMSVMTAPWSTLTQPERSQWSYYFNHYLSCSYSHSFTMRRYPGHSRQSQVCSFKCFMWQRVLWNRVLQMSQSLALLASMVFWTCQVFPHKKNDSGLSASKCKFLKPRWYFGPNQNSGSVSPPQFAEAETQHYICIFT